MVGRVLFFLFLGPFGAAQGFLVGHNPNCPSLALKASFTPSSGTDSLLGNPLAPRRHNGYAHLDSVDDDGGSDVTPISNDNPASVEIADSTLFEEEPQVPEMFASDGYPFALMMQGSGPYIAAHAGQTAVFHLPGDLLHGQFADSIINDIALARVLGMKIVLVVGSSYDTDICDMDFDNPSQCHNALTVTDEATLRLLEESAGYLRTEVERKLNRCVKMQGGVSLHGVAGFVVSGNFYTAQKFGLVQGKEIDCEQDFEFAGFTSSVSTNAIRKVLNNNDIVLLTTVGTTRLGDLVNVNGYHLAAATASALDAYKLVYFANEGSVLCDRDGKDGRKVIQELPLSFAQAITRYYGVDVHRAGFATFEDARLKLDPRSVELLLHLAWASWAVEEGVTRAHIVNPTDGALLEELFTSKNGANTCLYHDRELEQNEEDILEAHDWDSFFESAVRKGQRVAKFG